MIYSREGGKTGIINYAKFFNEIEAWKTENRDEEPKINLPSSRLTGKIILDNPIIAEVE